MAFCPLLVTCQNASVSEEDFRNEDNNVNNDTVHYDDDDDDTVFEPESGSQANRKPHPRKVTSALLGLVLRLAYSVQLCWSGSVSVKWRLYGRISCADQCNIVQLSTSFVGHSEF